MGGYKRLAVRKVGGDRSEGKYERERGGMRLRVGGWMGSRRVYEYVCIYI